MIYNDMKQYKLYVFDLDNTLYDEECFLIQAYKNISQRLSHINQSISSDEYFLYLVKHFEKKGRKYLFDYLIHDFNLDSTISVDQLKNILYRSANTARLELYTWVKPCFNMLLEQNKQIAILTNGCIEQQTNKIRNLGLDQLYPSIFIYYADQFRHSKPDPKGLNNIINTHQVMNNEVLMIGDHQVDRMCANNANVDFIHVSNFSTQKFSNIN